MSFFLPEILVEAPVGDTITLEYDKPLWVMASTLPFSQGFTYGSYADISGISLKGGHPKGNAVFLNGILINQPQNSYVDLTDISPFLFGNLSVYEGGFSPYSIYGNLNFSYTPGREYYGFLNGFWGFSFGYKGGYGGFDLGNLTGGRDSLFYAEGVFLYDKGFGDLRVSRKRTSGMGGFPQTSGIQTDIRVVMGYGDFNILILGREWRDEFIYSYHTNLRAGYKWDVFGYKLLTYAEGIKSSNIGEKIRPLIYLGRNFYVFGGYISGNLWYDGKRMGFGSFLSFPIKLLTFNSSFSNRIPSFDELYWKGAGAEGNPNLKNEKTFTISSEFKFKGLQISGFFRRIWDIIEWRNVGGIWRPENSSAGNIWGISLYVGFGFLRFKYDRLYAYYDNGKRMIYRPKNTYSVLLSYKPFSLSLLYLDPRFTNPANTRFVDYILNLNLSLNLDIKGYNLTFGIDNLLNRKNYFVEGYPSRGKVAFLLFSKQFI